MPSIVLSGPQQLELRNALVAAFLQTTFPDLLNTIDKKFFPPLNASFPEAVFATIKAAESEDWLFDLVQAAAQQRPEDPALQRLANELGNLRPAAPPAGISPFDVCCLAGTHVMVDRRDLRAALRDLSKADGKRILVVKDDLPDTPAGSAPKTGKSHTMQMIAYLWQTQRSFDFVDIDLEDMAHAISDIRPVDLAKRLIKKLGFAVNLAEPTDNAWARWNLDFCDDLEGWATQRNRPVWIVIDSFNLVLLPQATLDLIKELANRINLRLADFRLVLLGYRDTFPTKVKPIVEEEKIRPIGEGELLEFFAHAYFEKNIPVTGDEILDAVERVFAQLSPTQADFLIQLASLSHAELKPRTQPPGGVQS